MNDKEMKKEINTTFGVSSNDLFWLKQDTIEAFQQAIEERRVDINLRYFSFIKE